MRANLTLFVLLMLTGTTGYLLFDGIGTWSVLWVAGPVAALSGFQRWDRSGYDQGCHCNASMVLKARNHTPRWPWRQGNAAQAEQRRRLETLLSKARFLATTCQDSYGARTYCMEIIRQTRQEDPLFIQAFDLYMHTVTHARWRPDGQQHLPKAMLSDRDVQSEVIGDNVIPFPLNACRN